MRWFHSPNCQHKKYQTISRSCAAKYHFSHGASPCTGPLWVQSPPLLSSHQQTAHCSAPAISRPHASRSTAGGMRSADFGLGRCGELGGTLQVMMGASQRNWAVAEAAVATASPAKPTHTWAKRERGGEKASERVRSTDSCKHFSPQLKKTKTHRRGKNTLVSQICL